MRSFDTTKEANRLVDEHKIAIEHVEEYVNDILEQRINVYIFNKAEVVDIKIYLLQLSK